MDYQSLFHVTCKGFTILSNMLNSCSALMFYRDVFEVGQLKLQSKMQSGVTSGLHFQNQKTLKADLFEEKNISTETHPPSTPFAVLSIETKKQLDPRLKGS